MDDVACWFLVNQIFLPSSSKFFMFGVPEGRNPFRIHPCRKLIGSRRDAMKHKPATLVARRSSI
jgi:hypothetical protein